MNPLRFVAWPLRLGDWICICGWGLGGTQLPFGEELQGRFPLAGRFLDDHGKPAVSQLSPEFVALALQEALA